ncbi:MAG TPA: PLDc_N domain-containing protein [Dehalococcoidia bacterium]|nr:PLDc_N domain-containing protein [Dehalococcoidia bacterium]HIK98986.1 PLDc_N domain-containing protein [Dehalococcoidia bacterium]
MLNARKGIELGIDTSALPALVFIEIDFKVFAINHVWRRSDLESSTRWVWIAVIALISLFGWLPYLVFGRQPRNA